jgi:hypothetical protein
VNREPPPRDFEAELDPAALPRLALFLAGSLHQDLAPEHGSAARAAYEYAAAAELDELEELAHDWETLLAAARVLPLERINALLRERFGSAWRATTVQEIEAVAEEFRRALRE